VIADVPRTIRQALLLIGALALSLSNVACGQKRGTRMLNLDELLTVNTDGSLDVTERLSIRFTGRWSRIQHDLWLRPSAAWGRPEFDIRQVSATDSDGQPFRVEAYRGGTRRGGSGKGLLHVGIWVTPYPINEDRTVIVRYHVTNAIRFGELLWSVNDGGSSIDKANVVVVLPNDVVPTRTVVYTRDSDMKYAIPGFNPAAKVAADAKIETNGNTIGISLPRALAAFEVITILVGWPSAR
jgi:hypothetical protein